jgi:hypothetical protein
MEIDRTTSNILSNITVDKSKLSIFLKYEMRVWCGVWCWGRGVGRDKKEYLSELKSSLNQIKKQ